MTASKFVEKPWGSEEIFGCTDKYVGKILTIKEGYSLSRQYHQVKDETIRVLENILILEIGTLGKGDYELLQLNPGDSYHIKPGVIHRMSAPKRGWRCVGGFFSELLFEFRNKYNPENYYVKVLEVSTPELDDVVRLEDNYGRV